METSAVTTSPHSTKHEDAGMVIGVGIHGAGIGPEDSPIRWGTFLSVLLWNTSGYDSVGALAAEVHDPGRDFPRAMYATITLITLVYLVPLLVATSLDSEHVHEWTDGSFVSRTFTFREETLGHLTCIRCSRSVHPTRIFLPWM